MSSLVGGPSMVGGLGPGLPGPSPKSDPVISTTQRVEETNCGRSRTCTWLRGMMLMRSGMNSSEIKLGGGENNIGLFVDGRS